MKVYYMNDFTDAIISLDKLANLSLNVKIATNYNGREILYTKNDIYNCKDWKVYTFENDSLDLDDIRNLMSKVDRDSVIYNKLLKTEQRLLNILIEDTTMEQERSLF